MKESEIRPFLEAEPFEPFTVHMPHGVEYDVDRPERASFSPYEAMYIYFPTGELRAVLSLDHVVGITFAAKPVIRGS
jgi:hypothetical protein